MNRRGPRSETQRTDLWRGGGNKTFLPGVSRRERRMAWSIMSSTAFEVKENEDANLPRVSREEETVTLTVWKAERPYLERGDDTFQN